MLNRDLDGSCTLADQAIGSLKLLSASMVCGCGCVGPREAGPAHASQCIPSSPICRNSASSHESVIVADREDTMFLNIEPALEVESAA